MASAIAVLSIIPFVNSPKIDNDSESYSEILTNSISKLVSEYSGEIGVAVIINDSDTVIVNNSSTYPMMSVFKVHQALAVCKYFDNNGISLDSMIYINRDELDSQTWSPMMKDYCESEFSITVKDLLCYTLIQSDNNASNYMFKKLVNIVKTDNFIATLIPRTSFQIAYTEKEMSVDHNKIYSNYTSPLGAAMLMNSLFTDSIVSKEKQRFIMNTLGECMTGKDRIIAPLLDKEGVSVAHKTGSGFTNEKGEFVACNDLAYICLPNNVHYTLAVFIKDFKGNAEHASSAVANISAIVYSSLGHLIGN